MGKESKILLPILGIVIAIFITISMINIFNESTWQAEAQPAGGNILYVGGGGPGNYSSIQDAINAANDEDTIFVYNGTYYENVVVNKSINLVGDHVRPIIKGGVNITANNASLSWFRMENNNTLWPDYWGIVIYHSNNISVSSCDIESMGGIWIRNSLNNIVANCNISALGNYSISVWHSFNNKIENCSTWDSDGIIVYHSNWTTIKNCWIDGDNGNFSGMEVDFSANTVISYCYIQNSYGIDIYDSTNTSISRSGILRNSMGLEIMSSSGVYIQNCNISSNDQHGIDVNISTNSFIISNSYIGFNGANGIQVAYSSNGTIYNNSIVRNRYGIYLLNSANNSILNCNTINNYVGIEIEFSHYNIISNCIMGNNYYGIELYSSSNNIVSNCNIHDNSYDGVEIGRSTNNIISNTDIVNNDRGVYLFSSTNNIISDCSLNYNEYGIKFYYSDSNSVLNCSNINDNYYHGISLYASNNNFIYNCTTDSNNYGIVISSSINNVISNCSMINNSWNGIHIYKSHNVSITNCTIAKNGYNGLWIGNSYDLYVLNNTISNNSMQGDGLCAFNLSGITNSVIAHNRIVSNDWGIFLYDGSNNTISSNVIIYCDEAMDIWDTSNNSIYSCSIYNCDKGVLMSHSFNNRIYNCNISAISHCALDFVSSEYNHIEHNQIYSAEMGIRLRENSQNNYIKENNLSLISYIAINLTESSNNLIENNNIKNNSLGIALFGSNNNTIVGNDICYNSWEGIMISWPTTRSGNYIYHNNFISNNQNAYDECNDTWDNGYPSGGNYWSDFDEPSEGAYDNNSDGIVDSPYHIPGGSNVDRYPLANPYNHELVACWHFDEGQGNITHDSSGNGNDGTIYGATWTDGINEKALYFDGSNDYIKVYDSYSLDISEKITIEAWVKPYSFSSTPNYIIHKTGYGGASYSGAYNLQLDGGHIVFGISGPAGIEVYSNKTIKVGEWSYVVCVYDGSSIKIYINGVLDKSVNFSSPIQTTNGDLYIGLYWCGVPSCNLFHGILDEISIYNTALTENEIWLHYIQFLSPSIVYVDDDWRGLSNGTTVHINGIPFVIGYNAFVSIQDAIDAVAENGTVYVFNGTYYENVVINKSINLIGEDRNGTWIDSQKIHPAVVEIFADSVKVSNFTIHYGLHDGITLMGNNSIIENCIIFSNGDNGTTIVGKNVTIQNIQIYNHTNNGIQIFDSRNITIYKCDIYNNYFNGIKLCYSHNNTIVNCSVFNNSNMGISLFYSTNNTISGCNIRYSLNATWIEGNNNILRNNMMGNSTYYGAVIWSNNNTFIGCNFSSNNEAIRLANASNNYFEKCFFFRNYVLAIGSRWYEMDRNYNNKFIGCKFMDNGGGLNIPFSPHTLVMDCEFFGGNTGINISSNSNYTRIINCSVRNAASYGIFIAYGSNLVIDSCNITNSNIGIAIWPSDNVTITKCKLINNSCGIYIPSGSGIGGNRYNYTIRVFNNYFDNAINAISQETVIWNISKISGTNIVGGPYLGGNYWSDYTGIDLNGDGLGDTDLPYGPGDWLPLVEPNYAPVANFSYSPQNPTDMDTISFTDLSYDNDGSIVNWTWSFGDGSVSYEQNPSHKYADDGIYNVTLIITDNDGATDTIQKSMVVSNVPPVAINDTAITDEDMSIVINVSVNDYDVDGILNLSSIAIISLPVYGNAIVIANGTITYAPDENYYGYDEFSYAIKDDDGATSNVATVTITINSVNDAPVVNDDSYTTDEDTTLAIDAPGVLANDYDVDGDALTAVLVSNPSHGSLIFNSNGSFIYAPDENYYGTDSFAYKAYDGSAYSNVATVTITINSVNDAPVVNFSFNPSNPTDLDVVHFTDLSYDLDGSIVNWTWNFGDGNIAYGQNPSHQYADDGIYNVTLTVTDNDGATGSIMKQIVVSNVPPVANFSYSPMNPKVGQNITFDASLSYDSDGSIVNYTWQFGGSVAYGIVVIHSYAYVGKYNITLIVTDDDGATASTTKQIVVRYPPSPPTPPELPEPWVTIKFNGSYEWNGTRWLVTPETKICFDMDLLRENGIMELFYQIDYNGWKEYRDCFNLSLGKHFIYYYGKDEYGLKSSVVSICIEVVESLSPTTDIVLSPSHPDGNNGWYRSVVTISFEAYDDTGINATYYRIDDGKWMKYESSIKIGSDGKHIISFYSIDEYGNKEAIKTKEIKIDKTAPQISFKKPSHYLYVFGRKLIPLKNTIIIGKAFVEVDLQDSIGIEKVEFYIDGELKATMQSTPYSWQWNEAAIGKHEIMVKAYDMAGNFVTANQKIWIFNLFP